MKLHLTKTDGNQMITAFSGNAVSINHVPYSHSILVTADVLYTDWNVADFDRLTTAHFERIASLQPEVVLLGTGSTHRFVHPKLSLSLTSQGIPVECMTTDAACRTYNILMSEGRKVVAALIVQAQNVEAQ